jgi:hypothetical protein
MVLTSRCRGFLSISHARRVLDFWLARKDELAKLRCYLRRHRWVQKVQAGEIYYACRDCGKDRAPIQTALPIIWPRQKP